MQGSAGSKYDLVGFKLPSGDVVSPAFVDAWKHGGALIFDDCDRSDARALASLNGAIANGVLDLSHAGMGLVPRHPDCYIIATGNTAMDGQDRMYSAASKQDGAFKDRFQFHHMELDESFELEQVASNRKWCQRVQKIRHAVAEIGGKAEQTVMSTMRATLTGERQLATGALSQAEVEESVIFKGCAADVRTLVYSKVGEPSHDESGVIVNYE
jgi:hypothetical protein